MVNWIKLDICTAVLPSCWLRRSSTQPNRNTVNSTKGPSKGTQHHFCPQRFTSTFNSRILISFLCDKLNLSLNSSIPRELRDRIHATISTKKMATFTTMIPAQDALTEPTAISICADVYLPHHSQRDEKGGSQNRRVDNSFRSLLDFLYYFSHHIDIPPLPISRDSRVLTSASTLFSPFSGR